MIPQDPSDAKPPLEDTTRNGMVPMRRKLDTGFGRKYDREHVWHPFTPMQAWREEQFPVIRCASGFELLDTEGKTYLDGISSLWCNVHGYGVPEIDRAIESQLRKVSHTTLLGLASETSVWFAKKLIEKVPPGLSKVFYSDSGATAVEVALKMAYQYHRQKPGGPERRDRFVRVGGAYHGDTLGAASVGGIDLFHAVYGDLLFESLQVPSPVALRTPPGHDRDGYLRWCSAELERVIVENAERIAAVVMEPLVQGAAGILVHPPGYLRRVRELTRAHGIPLIADEVAVGFGRTGTLFACEQEGVTPDFLCLAKGITGGYLPLAATVTTDAIYEAFLGEPHEGRTFFHGHTYTGNPLGCAAAVASLELFEKSDVLGNVGRISRRIAERLAALKGHPHVAEVRRKGVMVGIELVKDRDGLVPFPAERRTGHLVTLAARKRGVILRPLGDVAVLMPAPAMPIELVDRLCDAAIESIDEATTG